MDSHRPKEAMESSPTPNFSCPFIQPPNTQDQDLQPELGHNSNPAGSAEQCFTGVVIALPLSKGFFQFGELGRKAATLIRPGTHTPIQLCNPGVLGH